MLADLGYTLLTNTSCPGSGPEDELPLWLETLSHISLGITTFFLIEIPLQLWAFGPIFYNPFRVLHGGLHLFDAVVILTTFVLEVVLKGRERELAGLLILLRLWRLVKLVGGQSIFTMCLNYELNVSQVLRLGRASSERKMHKCWMIHDASWRIPSGL